MALTREIELRLERASLIAYFTANEAAWRAAAQDAYDYTKKPFAGAPVRPDDIAKPLRGVVEVHVPLRNELSAKKLKEKYWIDFFTILVIDRSWPHLIK